MSVYKTASELAQELLLKRTEVFEKIEEWGLEWHAGTVDGDVFAQRLRDEQEAGHPEIDPVQPKSPTEHDHAGAVGHVSGCPACESSQKGYRIIVHPYRRTMPGPSAGGPWLIRCYTEDGEHVHSAEGGVSLEGGLREVQRAIEARL